MVAHLKALHHIGSVGGVAIRVHVLTYLLPVAVLAYGAYRGVPSPGLLWLLAFVVAVVACVLLHEAAHAVAARACGVPVHDILLLPVGGAARLKRLPDTALREAGVVLAGPLANLALGLVMLPAALALPPAQRFFWEGNFTALAMLSSLAVFNLLVCALNLLPVFPLDGGRLLRAVLATRTTRLRATAYTAATARVLLLVALAFVTYRGDYLFILPLAYLFVVAGREVHLARAQQFLERERLGRHAHGVRVFGPSDTVADVLHQLERNGQSGAVIADECCPIGFVTPRLLRLSPDAAAPVGEMDMHPVVCHDSRASLKEISRQFSSHPRSVAIEELDGRPAGYLDLEGLSAAFEAYRRAR